MSEDGSTAPYLGLDEPALLRLSRGIDIDQIFVTELLRREGHADEDPPRRPTRTYRPIAVGAGVGLLIAVLTASTVAMSGQRTVRAAPSSVTPRDIIGADALRPELINSSVQIRPRWTAAGDGRQQPSVTPQAATTPLHPDLPAPSWDVPQPPPATAPVPPANLDTLPPPAVHHPLGEIADIVTAFYETAPVAPLRAFDMLDPPMRGSGYGGFQQAWAGIERATVDNIRLDGPGAALVCVSLVRRDGTVLRTLERITVTPGAQPRITGARLLSASQTSAAQTGAIAGGIPGVEGPNLSR